MFRDFYFTLNFVRDFVTQNDLLNLYKQLISSYEQILSSYSPEIDQQIKELKSKIVNPHSRINWLAWSAPKVSLAKRIGAYDLIGPEVLSRIEKIFTQSTSSQSIISDLNLLLKETTDLLQKSEELIKSLNLTPEEKNPERKVIELSLEGNSALENFWEMGEKAKDLNFIIRACTRVAGEPFNSVKIVSLNTASPEVGIYIESLVKTAQVIIALSIFAAALRKLKDTLWDKKKKLESVGLSKKTLKISIKDLEVQNKNEYKIKVAEFGLKLVKEHGSKKEDHEVESLAIKALERLTTLLGDETRVLDPEQIQPTKKLSENSLPEIYKEIKRLKENHLPLLAAENKRRLGLRKKRMLEEIEGKKLKKVRKQGTNKKPNS